MRRLSRHLSLLALAALLTACGGPIAGGGLPIIPLTGVFIDSPVEGLTYTSGMHSGVTGPTGLFTYELGSDVTFSIGDIVLGSGPGRPIMTPVSLVPGAVDENNQAVYNIAWFLLALDDDANPANGILITEDVRTFATSTVSFNVSAVDFLAANATLVSALTGGRNMSSVTGIKAHLRDSILATMAGKYNATLDGDDTGTMTVAVTNTGNLSGTGNLEGTAGGTPFSVSGTVKSDRTATFSATGGITFTGTISTNGVFDGTWERTSGEKGTFHATHPAA